MVPAGLVRIGAAAAVLALLGALPAGEAFMYRPAAGLVWDPSCFTWEGKTYCYFMYICGIGTPGCTQNSSHYGHGLVALASDGVHFETHSAFNAEYGDVGWFKHTHEMRNLRSHTILRRKLAACYTILL